MEVICICTFGDFGKIKGISFQRVYNVKYSFGDKLLILNDYGRPQMVKSNNFVSYHKIKKF